ncbi:hypothetical protein VTI74DRAFT_271 [Chaetomium olivicolor]
MSSTAGRGCQPGMFRFSLLHYLTPQVSQLPAHTNSPYELALCSAQICTIFIGMVLRPNSPLFQVLAAIARLHGMRACRDKKNTPAPEAGICFQLRQRPSLGLTGIMALLSIAADTRMMGSFRLPLIFLPGVATVLNHRFLDVAIFLFILVV